MTIESEGFAAMKSTFSEWLGRLRAARPRSDKRTATSATSVLLAGSGDDDVASLRGILEHSRWTLVHATTWTAALGAQQESGFPIVLYDRDLSGVPWHEGVRLMMRAGHPPAVILLSNVADPYLWDKVVQAGGFDVLTRPFRREETLAMLDFAYTHWRTSWVQKPASA